MTETKSTQDITTTASGRQVRIKTGATGRNFGHVGLVRAMNNRTIAETDVWPTAEGAKAAAIELAESLR